VFEIVVTPGMRKLRVGPFKVEKSAAGPLLDPVGTEGPRGIAGPICFPHHDNIRATNLTSLFFFGIDFDPVWLEQTIKAGHLTKTKVLRVSEYQLGQVDGPHTKYDWARLSTVMEEHMPNLEILEWGRSDFGDLWTKTSTHRPWGSLKRCVNLPRVVHWNHCS
jgi:hypothetical protein